ncbi:MAG: hypothetical protein N2316_00230 [Spirochaetes bacterium]|nr:hypothetical protein [Spirochaetota bacterium]
MTTDILQSIKLEISKGFKLSPYERIALHKILGLKKSQEGMKILINDVYKDPLFRESAICELKNSNSDEVKKVFRELLSAKLTNVEMTHVFDYFEKYATKEDLPLIQELCNKHAKDSDPYIAIRACKVLGLKGLDDPSTVEFLKRLSFSTEVPESIRAAAIIAGAFWNDISKMEELLKENRDEIQRAVYKSLALLSEKTLNPAKTTKSEEDEMFSYNPETEDKAIISVRVLLGKMTSHFDNYSTKVKVEFINAMLGCNHRETLIYIMKALTSDNPDLVENVLYTIYANIEKIRDPDSLFKSLISLSVQISRHNSLIADIFEKYFTTIPETRKNSLMRDKIFNYLTVTLETFFEVYRKEFMITSVTEKDFPENFQQIRQYILERYSPEIKKRIIHYLRNQDKSHIQRLLEDLSHNIHFMGTNETEEFSMLVEILYDADPRSRELSAVRLEDINFEKKYLRHKITRLCEIIGRLGITGAASILVKIYNYVKKYVDEEIAEAVTRCLSVLNYSYMLGELEIMLLSGELADHQKAISLISQFSDSRSLNILLDYLREHADQPTDIILEILEIILRRDLRANVTAAETFKMVIEKNQEPEIITLAIICLGKCGFESDLEYLDSIFRKFDKNEVKEAVVLSMGYIIEMSDSYNKRHVIGFLQEYLKEPGIKIRIYACALLISLGNRDALRAMRDMMVIKNKTIQREILLVMTQLKSVEFSYFLISLLKEDYGISSDIISALRTLPEEELTDIDHFIVNIFKKFESPDSTLLEGSRTLKLIDDERYVKTIETKKITILAIEISDLSTTLGKSGITKTALMLETLREQVVEEINMTKGTVTMMGKDILVAYYTDPNAACHAMLRIKSNLETINLKRSLKEKFTFCANLFTDEKKFLRGDMLFLDIDHYIHKNKMFLKNRIILDDKTSFEVKNNFHAIPLPPILFDEILFWNLKNELVTQINFLSIAENILKKFINEEEERKKIQQKLEEELKKQKKGQRNPTAIAYAQALENIGKILKNDLNEVNKYLLKRSSDKELINTVSKMLANAYKRYIVEVSKIIME